MITRDITRISVIAALYVVLTIAVSPLAYGVLQFRISELLKPLALHGKKYVIALTLGLILANLFSPFLGIFELLLMPAACLIGGEITYRLRRWPVVAMTIYSIIISIGVALTLHIMANLPFLPTLAAVWIPEVILMQLGRPIVDSLLRRTENMGS